VGEGGGGGEGGVHRCGGGCLGGSSRPPRSPRIPQRQGDIEVLKGMGLDEAAELALLSEIEAR
jgi:hypothetical protein